MVLTRTILVCSLILVTYSNANVNSGDISFQSLTKSDLVRESKQIYGGCRCPPGPPGPPGQPGRRGENGHPGRTGRKGPSGRPGEPGHQGHSGPRGLAGRSGLVGRHGPPGRDGPEGPVGPPGFQGRDGPIGPVGRPGVRGLRGRVGRRGRRGPHGRRGPRGFRGSAGFSAQVDSSSLHHNSNHNNNPIEYPFGEKTPQEEAAAGSQAQVIDNENTIPMHYGNSTKGPDFEIDEDEEIDNFYDMGPFIEVKSAPRGKHRLLNEIWDDI